MGLWGIRLLGGGSELFGGFIFGAVLVFALAVSQPFAVGKLLQSTANGVHAVHSVSGNGQTCSCGDYECNELIWSI